MCLWTSRHLSSRIGAGVIATFRAATSHEFFFAFLLGKVALLRRRWLALQHRLFTPCSLLRHHVDSSCDALSMCWIDRPTRAVPWRRRCSVCWTGEPAAGRVQGRPWLPLWPTRVCESGVIVRLGEMQ